MQTAFHELGLEIDRCGFF